MINNGFTVYWDGYSQVQVHAPTEYQGTLRGLCGTFSGDQSKDFLTSSEMTESDPNIFGNSWKVSGQNTM